LPSRPTAAGPFVPVGATDGAAALTLGGSAAPPPGPAAPAGQAGRRRALCVGIDRYPTMPLAGCVADARDWAHALETLGFSTALLLDDAATPRPSLAAPRA